MTPQVTNGRQAFRGRPGPPPPRARPCGQTTFGGETGCQGMSQSEWEPGWAARLRARGVWAVRCLADLKAGWLCAARLEKPVAPWAKAGPNLMNKEIPAAEALGRCWVGWAAQVPLVPAPSLHLASWTLAWVCNGSRVWDVFGASQTEGFGWRGTWAVPGAIVHGHGWSTAGARR